MARKGSFCYTTELSSPVFLPVLGAGIVLYMLFGALVFSTLEGPQEEVDLARFRRAVAALADAQNITMEKLKAILNHYDELKTSGFLSEDLETERRVKWDFIGGFVFAGTVVTTMGFGFITPVTRGARLFYLIFCLLGCSAVFLFFNTWLVRFIEHFTRIALWAKKRKHRRGDQDKPHDENFKASPGHVLLAFSAMTLSILLISSAIYNHAEKDWDFLDSLYYCFTAFSTIGFGDFVSGQDEEYTIDRYLYNVLDAVLMTFGCCCVYSLFNLISLFIKKFIEGTIKRASRHKKDEINNKSQSDLASIGMSEGEETRSNEEQNVLVGSASGSVIRNANQHPEEKDKLPESDHGLYNDDENEDRMVEMEETESLQGERCASCDLRPKGHVRFEGQGHQAELPRQHKKITSAPATPSFQDSRRNDVESGSVTSAHAKLFRDSLFRKFSSRFMGRPPNRSCESSPQGGVVDNRGAHGLSPKATKVKMHDALRSDLLNKAKLEIYMWMNGNADEGLLPYKGLRRTSSVPVYNCTERYEIPHNVLHSPIGRHTSASIFFEIRRVPTHPDRIVGRRRTRAKDKQDWLEDSDVFPLSIMKNEMRC